MKPVVLLLVLPFTVLPPAAASSETCQGRTATIVGAHGEPLRGTEGADVVVTNGAPKVEVLAGDDLVCVTGRQRDTYIDAGAGADVVDASADPTGARAVLGPGADRYIGSSGPDIVEAGTALPDRADLDADEISTGPHGAEPDVVATGQAGSPNSDTVVMGSGRLEWYGLATPATSVDGGVATELQLLADRPQNVTIDAVAGTAVVDSDHDLTFRNVVRFRLVTPSRAPRQLTYTGRPYLDELTLVTGLFPPDARHSVSMGRGNDRLSLEAYGPIPAGVRYDSGQGRHDTIDLTMTEERNVTVDLGRGRLEVTRGSRTGVARISGFEDADVRARDAAVVGSSDRNILRAHACRVRMGGGAGQDQLTWMGQGSGEELLCLGRRARLVGGGGRDFLTGSPGADVLDGGPGADTARGRAGRDVCRAETVRSCEVRR